MLKLQALAIAVLVVAGSLAPARLMAQISYTTAGSTYTQNFDSLDSANGNTNLTWTNNTTLPGWFLFVQPAPGTAPATYRSSIGNDTTGSFYSFGQALPNNADRAFGSIASGGTYFGSPSSGSIAGWSAVGITNNTGMMLEQFTIQYDGEQWRAANTNAQSLVLEYGFGSSFTTVAAWIAPGSGFNFTSPNLTTGGAINGNDAANRVAGLGGTISDLEWNVGDTLWIRWADFNDAGNDHGLAIDNFSFTAVPEPTTLTLIGLASIAVGYVGYRRRKNLMLQDAQLP